SDPLVLGEQGLDLGSVPGVGPSRLLCEGYEPTPEGSLTLLEIGIDAPPDADPASGQEVEEAPCPFRLARLKGAARETPAGMLRLELHEQLHVQLMDVLRGGEISGA